MSEKAKYLLIGAAIALAVMLSVGANLQGPAGSYQVAASSNFYVVVDTRTGEVVQTQCGVCLPAAPPTHIPAPQGPPPPVFVPHG